MEDNALVPTPLELLKAPKSLSGESGTNRAPAFITQQISATNDLQAVQCWLAEFDKSPQTQRSYRKEAERLLLWSLIEKQKPLSSLARDDLRDYQQCQIFYVLRIEYLCPHFCHFVIQHLWV